MRFITIFISTLASRPVPLATAKPIPNWKAGGFAIPLARYSFNLNSSKSIDLDAISSHAISVREKIFNGLENYEMNTGTMHPFAVKWNVSESEFGLRRRGASLPLTSFHDETWMGEISIGTPPKALNVRIDTGSADMWVLQSGCRGVSPGGNFWNPHSSESVGTENKPFMLQYADGTIIEGQLYTDTVTIAGFTIPANPGQTFGSATSYTSQLQNDGQADGVLGLAFVAASKFGVDSLLPSLARQSGLNPIFSLKLSSAGAEMYVGGADSRLYRGEITYTPVTVSGFWQVSMDDVSVNGNRILLDAPVIFDTGSAYIFGDQMGVEELYQHLGGTLLPENSGVDFYHIPCDASPTVGLGFGGKTFDIPPELLKLGPIEEGSPNCFSAIIGVPGVIDFWIIGTTFLQGVYSVFDYSGSKVGFAALA